MKESRKGKCEKCKKHFYIHKHHIYPKSKFGSKGETVDLCPNCHTHFHEYSKQHTKDPEDKNEALKIWTTWFKVISVTVGIVVLGLFILNQFV